MSQKSLFLKPMFVRGFLQLVRVEWDREQGSLYVRQKRNPTFREEQGTEMQTFLYIAKQRPLPKPDASREAGRRDANITTGRSLFCFCMKIFQVLILPTRNKKFVNFIKNLFRRPHPSTS